MITLKKLKENPPSGGVAQAGITVKNKTLNQIGTAIMKNIKGWRGPFVAEFKYYKNKYYFMEVNPRLFGYTALAAEAGINFPLLICNILEGKKFSYSDDYKQGLCFLRGNFDLFLPQKRIIK